jgi:hypothetical protein
MIRTYSFSDKKWSAGLAISSAILMMISIGRNMQYGYNRDAENNNNSNSIQIIIIIIALWPESASELYRPNDHRLSAKLVPTFVEREREREVPRSQRNGSPRP